MFPTKFPKCPHVSGVESYQADKYDFRKCCMFNEGYITLHARYLIEMSFKHPIMYVLWYRWWIVSLIHKDDRTGFELRLKTYRSYYRPYWAEFSSHHPIQYVIFLLLHLLVLQTAVKLLTSLVKIVSRFLEQCVCCFTKKTLDQTAVDNEFVEK